MSEAEYEVEDQGRTVRIASVLGNPRRLRIMIALHQRGSASASVLSKAGLGENHDVDYHHRKLESLGAARVAETKMGGRGAPQRFYELTDFGREALRAAAILGRKGDL
jgi:predicted ArsR family transcriptional regulator